MRKKLKSYSKIAFYYLGSSIFASAINIAINPWMAKNLSPEDYAIIGYFTSFQLLILPILSFNLVTFYTKSYFQTPEEKRIILGDSILIASLVYGLFSMIACYLLFYLYYIHSGISFPFFPYALLAFGPIWLNIFLNFRLVQCRLNRKAKTFAVITILNALLTATFSIFIVVIFKYGAIGKLGATFISSLIIAIISWRKSFIKWEFDIPLIKQAFIFGFPLTLSGILWYFFSNVDRAFLAPLNNNSTLGIYNIAIQMAGILTVFYTVVAQTFEPDIYQAIANKKTRKVLTLLCAIFIFNALPNLVFIPFAPFIIGLLTANRYVDASSFAVIFVLKNITMSLYYLTVMIVIGYGHTKQEFLIRLIGTIISLFMLKVLINKYLFYGAAWSQVISFLILSSFLITYLLIFRKVIFFNPKSDEKSL